jgi:L,D-transpeptidase catalytic domain
MGPPNSMNSSLSVIVSSVGAFLLPIRALSVVIVSTILLYNGVLQAQTGTAFRPSMPAPALQTTQTESFSPAPFNVRVIVDKTSQMLFVMEGDLVKFKTPCGTGTELIVGKDDRRTKNGEYTITTKEGKDAISTLYAGARMPYRMQLDKTNMFIHGSEGFVQLKGSDFGIPQSHGCIRVSTAAAIEIQKLITKGKTKVEVKGSLDAFVQGNEVIKSLFDNDAGNYTLKILRDPSPQNIQNARNAFFAGTLLVKGKVGSRSTVVGYPFLPASARIPIAQFERLVLTDDEKSRGRTLTRVQ